MSGVEFYEVALGLAVAPCILSNNFPDEDSLLLGKAVLLAVKSSGNKDSDPTFLKIKNIVLNE